MTAFNEQKNSNKTENNEITKDLEEQCARLKIEAFNKREEAIKKANQEYEDTIARINQMEEKPINSIDAEDCSLCYNELESVGIIFET